MKTEPMQDLPSDLEPLDDSEKGEALFDGSLCKAGTASLRITCALLAGSTMDTDTIY